jgi:hypothetical protein
MNWLEFSVTDTALTDPFMSVQSLLVNEVKIGKAD